MRKSSSEMENTIISDLCHEDDLENNSMKSIDVKLPGNGGEGAENSSVKVLLVKHENKFYCVGAKCSHYSVPLASGVLYKGRLRCFAHGACFDVKTGDIEDFPGVDCLPKYNVHVDERTRIVRLTASVDELQQSKRVKRAIELRRTSIPNDPVSRAASRSMPRCLIIGSGAAGVLCMETLREHGFGSNITLITRDAYPPYDRPKLSKALDVKIGGIVIRDEDYMRSSSINFYMNQQVERIEFDKKRVHCRSGRDFDYDKLIIATGMQATRPESKTPGFDLLGIFTLRTYDDAKSIVEYFEELSRQRSNENEKKLNVVLVGGSFIAMEAACFFAGKATTTTVMSRRKPFESVFGTQVAVKVLRLHESKGVKFYINEKFSIVEYIQSKERAGHLGYVKLNDGSKYPADLCIMAIGGKPCTEFLRNTPIKLTLENYVIVNETMRTNLDDVYAVGDITYFPRSCIAGLEFTLSKQPSKLDHINIGHWALASTQGQCAAVAIATGFAHSAPPKALRVVPFFWSVNHGKSIRFAGYNEHHDSVIFLDDKTKANEFKFAAFYLIGNRVVAVCTLDWDPVCAAFAEAMYNRIEVRREHIEADPLNIKRLLV
jgi:apoptosis-inducing factor 3